MNMTAIEKAKEALEAAQKELPELSSAPNGKEPRAIMASRLVSEALAAFEAEKPAENNDLDALVSEIVTGSYGGPSFIDIREYIRKYAEAYHARLCAGCKDIDLDDMRHDRDNFTRFETRSGITTDVGADE